MQKKKKSKRKKEGVYYTPSYITQYIVEQAVGGWLNDQKKEIGFEKLPILTDIDFASIRRKQRGQIVYNNNIKQHINAWEDYKLILSDIKILDPACGSGAFLIEAYDYLLREEKAVNNELANLKGGQWGLFDSGKPILTNNIYGVDINHEAVEITKLALWLKTANKHEKLACLDNNIKCGDSLIDDSNISNILAFDWRNEFPEIIGKGGFDVVIGNPPYVFSREKIELKEKEYFSQKYKSAKGQINTYLLFIERSLQLIKNKTGHLNFIIPNTWLMISSAVELRRILLAEATINRVTNLTGRTFENINVETTILDLTKQKAHEKHTIGIFQNNKDNEFELLNSKLQDVFEKNKHLEFQIFNQNNDVRLIQKLKNNSCSLEDLASVKTGLKAYQVGKGTPKQKREDVSNRIYDYDHKHDDNTYFYLDGKDVSRYHHRWNGSFLNMELIQQSLLH